MAWPRFAAMAGTSPQLLSEETFSVRSFIQRNPGRQVFSWWRTSVPCETLARRIIACLDVDGGRVVKGVRFANLRDAGDPAELAWAHSQAGADEIVLLDITATSGNRAILIETVRRTASRLFL